tara:strand:+ start:369 stop:470 length:102 start_codon:yes stop_codon:yes gene_type:complete
MIVKIIMGLLMAILLAGALYGFYMAIWGVYDEY